MKIKIKAIISFIVAIMALSIQLYSGESGGYIDGWGIDTLIVALGLFGMFWQVREKASKRNRVLNLLCVCGGFFMVIGPAFAQRQSWDILFEDHTQKLRTLIVLLGYSLILKNVVLFILGMMRRLPANMKRRIPCGRIEKWLFAEHPFWGTVLIVWIFAIPWLVCFFPGTLEMDAWGQLYQAYGYAELTGHHPVASTKLIGGAMYFGRSLFGSDRMGIFVYTFIQYVIQSMVFAYVIYLLGVMETPVILRWGALLFYSVFPLFPMWGYTVVKDSGYYISMLLFVVTMVHLLYQQEQKAKWWQMVLLVVSAIGCCCFRKDGFMVVTATLLLGLIVYKKLRLIFVCGILAGVVWTVAMNAYMASNEIPKGEIREAMSVPLQQTGRYVWAHYDEITQEEKAILESVFKVEVAALRDLYAPELSDPIKGSFMDNPTGEDLRAYLGVWWNQLLKHPGTYIQAFFNQTYGYFYPDKSISKIDEDIAVFYLPGDSEFQLRPGIESEAGRTVLEEYSRLVKRLPVVGMLYSVGMHGWLLIGCVFYLMVKKKWKELVVYIPGVCVFAISVLSPVNTCVRYMLPVMALLPVHIGWLRKIRK